VLTLFDDDWNGYRDEDDFSASADFTAITGARLASTDSKEKAMLATLAPGTHTAQISRKGDTSGVALIEVYDLP